MKNKACEIAISKAAVAAKWGEHCHGFLTKLLSKYPQFRMDAEQGLKHEFWGMKVVHGHDKEES